MAETYEACIAEAAAALARAQRLLTAEMQDYPTPVSGCDVQYNHLIAERRRVIGALDALQRRHFVPTPRMPVPGMVPESR